MNDTSKEYADILAEALAQINRAHINMALESGELEPIIDSLVGDENT